MAFPICESLGLPADSGVISLIGAGGKTSLMFGLARELAASGRTVLSTTTTNLFFPSRDQSPLTLVTETVRDLLASAGEALSDHPHISAGTRHMPDIKKLKGFSAPMIDEIRHAGLFDWILVEADGARQLPIKASDIHEPVIPASTTVMVHVTGLDALNTPVDEIHVHRPGIFCVNTGLAPGSRVDGHAMAVSCVVELHKALALAGSDPAAVIWLNKADNPERLAAGRDVAVRLKNHRRVLEAHLTRLFLQHHPHLHACLGSSDRKVSWPGRTVIASLANADPVREVVTL